MDDVCEPVKEKKSSLEWSDDACSTIAFKEFFPVLVKDLSVQKQIITRFLNFYLGGRRLKGLGVEDLVFAVLALTPRSPYDENIVWSASQFREDGRLLFLSPEDKLAADVKKVIDKPTEQNDNNRTEKNYIDLDKEEIEENEIPVFSGEAHNDLFNFSLFDELDDDLFNFSLLDELDISVRESKNGTSIQVLLENQENAPSEKNYDTDSSDFNSIWRKIFQDINFEPKPLNRENTMVTYGPVENAAFINFCNTVLDNWETDEKARAVLKSFFVVVALVLMRATVKGYKHLFTTFHSEKFLRFLRHMQVVPFSPPHKRCLKAAFRAFCRKDNNTSVMFAKLVMASEAITDKYLKYVFTNSLLNYTADYGLNLVSLWRSIHTAVKTKEKVKRIVELTTFDETRSSWERLKVFLQKYKSPAQGKLAYRWARILDSRYFSELSCQANYTLAVVLGVFAENINGNTGLWNATWVKNDEEEEIIKEKASQLYLQYNTMYDENDVR